MSKIAVMFVLLLASGALSGCGTMETLCTDGHGLAEANAYGGVEADLVHGREIYGGFRGEDGANYASCSLVRSWPYQSTAFFQTETGQKLDSALQKAILGPWLLAVDLPLSAAADTLLLPGTVAYSLTNHFPRMEPIIDTPDARSDR